MFQNFLRVNFRAVFFIFFCTLFSTENIFCISQNETQEQATEAQINKALQTRVLTLLDAYSIALHKIGIRISSLSLPSLTQEELKAEITDIQENLKAIKATHSLHVDRKQLERLTILLNALIKATETALEKSFALGIEADPSDINRGQYQISPEELEELLRSNEKRLRNFDHLITNMNKTTINRSYSWLSDKWNTPLFSITSLGAESNKDIYLSSILKRIGIYGSGLGLIVYNLPQSYIEEIPNQRLKGWVQWLKGITGDTPFSGTTSTTTRGFKTEGRIPSNWVFGNLDTISTTDALLKIQTVDELPLITQAGIGTPVQLTFNDTQVDIIPYLEGAQAAHTTITPNTQFKLHLENGNYIPFSYKERNSILKSINYDGNLYQCLSGGFIEEFAPGLFRDEITKQLVEVSSFKDLTLVARPEISGSDYITQNGTPIPPELIRGKNTRRFATETRNEQPKENISSYGLVNQIFGNFRWLVNPDLKLSFSLPIASLIAHQIKEDATILRQDLPQVCTYLHNKLRGEKEVVVSNYFVPKTTFADVIGRDEIKKQLQPIINFVSNPESYIQAGIQVPRGILLAGEPQTGKTSLVSAFAGTLSEEIRKTQGPGKDVKLFPIEVHYLIRNGIKFYMDILKDHAPCILFCDEFDLTGAQRSENKTFLAEALTALSGYATSSDLRELVIFVIATNRPENIDYAILQNGRCGTMLYFENPYFKDRKLFFEKFFETKLIDTKAFDLDLLAQETEACSYGTLQTIAHGILSTAEKYNQLPNQKHADEVLDTVVRKIILDADKVPDTKREILAARYGAKAFASVILNPDKKFVAATISKITEEIKEKHVLHHYDIVNDKEITGIRYGGIFSYNQSDTYGLVSNEERLKECKIALAGTVGQRVLNLDYISYPEDEMQALKIARRIVFNGCDERLYPRKVREEKSVEAYLLVEKCRQEMYDLLEEHRDSYEKLVDLLQHRQVIRTSDIKQCFNLTNFNLIDDYFSKIPPITDLEKADLIDDISLDELEEEEEEEEQLEAEKIAQQLQREKDHQIRVRKEHEAAEAAEEDDE